VRFASLNVDQTFIEHLAAFTNLTSLAIDVFAGIGEELVEPVDISRLESLVKLTDLAISGRVFSLDIPQLTTLKISRSKTLVDISALASLPNLKTLEISSTPVRDLPSLSNLISLRSLDLSHNWNLSNVSALNSSTRLESLDLSWTGVSDLFPLVGLTRLTSLNLSGAKMARAGDSLIPLARLYQLKTLNLRRTSVRDIRSLRELPVFKRGGILIDGRII
jgi:internalin A